MRRAFLAYSPVGGESGIRTHGRLITYSRFQDERDRPLRHLPVPEEEYSRRIALFRADRPRILCCRRGTDRVRADPDWEGAREVDRGRLLSGCTDLNPYRGFESLPSRSRVLKKPGLASTLNRRCYAPVAQWIERLVADQEVRGSSPFGRTRQETSGIFRRFCF